MRSACCCRAPSFHQEEDIPPLHDLDVIVWLQGVVPAAGCTAAANNGLHGRGGAAFNPQMKTQPVRCLTLRGFNPFWPLTAPDLETAQADVCFDVEMSKRCNHFNQVFIIFIIYQLFLFFFMWKLPLGKDPLPLGQLFLSIFMNYSNKARAYHVISNQIPD